MPIPWTSLMHTLQQPTLAALQGKFHAHLTLAPEPFQGQDAETRLQQLAQVCRHLRIKRTIIDLVRGPRRQQDAMTTSYFKATAPGQLPLFLTQLQHQADVLVEHGFGPLRVKVEHESRPTLKTFSPQRYHEVHFKLQMPKSRRRELQTVVEPIGLVLSTNPFAVVGEHVVQFANARLKAGNLADADEQVTTWTAALREANFDVVEVKRETVVIDSKVSHDSWWK